MRRLNPTVLALLGGVVILVLLFAYFATNRNPDQDKLTGNETAQASAPNPAKRCAAQSTYDLIKRELFRRAAELRGSDQAAYDRLVSYAVVRMENPVMESQDASNGAIHCSGSLSLDLPPGVAAVGGRHSLMADIDYTVQPAADGSGDVVLLSNADPIITPLATLARTAAPAPSPPPTVAPIQSNSVSPPQQANGFAPEAGRPAPAPAPIQPPANRPSFDCTKARSRGEVAVCSDGGLAALDRSMAAQYGRAMATATPEQQALLRRTRSRFLAYRDRCPDRQCMGDAYVGRMREIRDIMEGHWRASR
jgi:uncharacterized protein YecT (DUF1311 family)